MKKIINKTINISVKLAWIVLYMFIGMVVILTFPNTLSNKITELEIRNTSEIHNLTLNITNNCTNKTLTTFCKCNLINQWIYDNIEYQHRGSWDNSVTKTLETRMGVCRHNAILACSMLESINIKCRINTYQNTYNDDVQGHAWFEVDNTIGNENYVIKCDPTNDYTCARMSKETYIKDYGEPLR